MPAATGPANSCNPPVDADAAELAALEERHLLARLRQLDREEPATLAGPYHDRVVVLIGHWSSPKPLAVICYLPFRYSGLSPARSRESSERVGKPGALPRSTRGS